MAVYKYECETSKGSKVVYRVEKKGTRWAIVHDTRHYCVGYAKTKRDAEKAMLSAYPTVRQVVE